MEEKQLWNEQWREYREDDWKENHKYLISNYGRIKRIRDGSNNGPIVSGSLLNGYRTVHGIKKNGKGINRYLHKIVAMLFIQKASDDQKYVLHIDRNKENNRVANLRWANNEEKMAHMLKDPIRANCRNNVKLSETQVVRLKKMIHDPNRKTRMKIIARQFGISEMQLYRIKSGENWSHIDHTKY